jgi:hypothetical protein
MGYNIRRDIRRSWEDNIRMDRREIGCEDVYQVQGSVAGSCEHGTELSGSIKGCKLLD